MARKWVLAVIWAILVLPNYGRAGEATGLLPSRYSAADVRESPDFRRHVLPVLGRMGCNPAACHGSFQGQGGFRLSLFGYDFQADHDALTAGAEPRVNIATPKASLILNKPTSADDHGGGLRFAKGSWQYNLLRRWVEDGAKGIKPGDAQFVRLSVTPAEMTFANPGATARLRVFATWSDGATEDVTAISRFRSNDESIATVGEDGQITARSRATRTWWLSTTTAWRRSPSCCR